MNLSELVDSVLHDTTAVSLPLFRPELCLCAAIVLMLLVRLFTSGRHGSAMAIALAGSAAGLWFSLPAVQGAPVARQEIFTGLLVYDSFTLYFRAVLMMFAVLFVILTQLSGIPDREDAADFYCLVLGSTLGMCLMASSNHLLMIFLGVEMASVPSYALAGMLKGRRQSSEAALKYAVYGAGAAGVMLYGISLLAGAIGSCHLPTMAGRLAEMLAGGGSVDRIPVLVLGGLMTMVGLAFKLSAVPFHFWCPDVFEGASAEVNAFLSVASKAAAFALLIRVALGFGSLPPEQTIAQSSERGAMLSVADDAAPDEAVADDEAADPQEGELAADVPLTTDPTLQHEFQAKRRTIALEPVRGFMALVIAFIAVITCTFGNLAAYGQTNIKRLMAYSTIAHAGYMLMPAAAALVLVGKNPAAAERALAAIPFYIGVYLFMNLGAFAIIAFLRNVLRSEEIADYAGLVKRCPGVVVCLAAILFSLVGMPPLSGFVGKFAIFASLVDAIESDAARSTMLALLVIGGLNTALSLFYYVRVVKVMTIDPEPDSRLPVHFPLVSLRGAYVVAVTLPVLVLGVWWGDLYRWAMNASADLLQ